LDRELSQRYHSEISIPSLAARALPTVASHPISTKGDSSALSS
jgi:hypothetical protein